MNSTPTIVLYDGWCSLCSKSADKFTKLDNNRNRIQCIDLRTDPSLIDQHDLNPAEIRRVLHIITPDNQVLTAMNALREIMRILDRRWMIQWTRLPIVRPITDHLYLLFANNRHRLFKFTPK